MMFNLTYKIKENGYEIYKDGVLWISQYEPYIPNPNLSYEENAIRQIEELNNNKAIVETIESRVVILEEQNNQQEEIIANLTYEVMMLQEPVSIATLINSHSPKYSLIKSWFNKGYWNEEMVQDAVSKNVITAEEAKEILGK